MKNFLNYPISTFDGLPVNIGTARGVDPESVVLHNHKGIEINLILEGTTQYIISGKNYSCRKGDIIVIGDEEVHRAWNADDALFLVVQFRQEFLVDSEFGSYEQKYMAPYWAVEHDANHILSQSGTEYKAMVQDLLDLEREARERPNSYRLMLKAKLLSFSTHLTRHFEILDDSPLLEKGIRSRKFAPLLKFIEENFSEKLLVSDLADRVNMSVTNFARSFRSAFGKTPMEYVMQTRIRHASHLLQDSDRKVIDIANDCGFPSISHFVTCFRRYTGQVPHEYRRQQQT